MQVPPPPWNFHFLNTKIPPPPITPLEFPQVLCTALVPTGKNNFWQECDTVKLKS